MNVATPTPLISHSPSPPPVSGEIEVEALQLPARHSPPLADHDMPTSVARAVNGLSSQYQVPRGYMLVALIVAVLGLVGSRMVVRIGSHVQAAVAFGLLVGASGSRKTSAARIVVDILEAIDAQERDAHSEWRKGSSDLAVKLHLDALLKAHIKRVKDNIDAGNDDIIPIPELLARHAEGRQPEPTLVETRVTAAALLDALAESLFGIVLWFDEVAPLFARGGGAELRTHILRCFDAKPLTDRTRARGSRKIKTSAASLLSTIQPIMIPMLNLTQADGLFARFFYACPDPTDIAEEGWPPVDLNKMLTDLRGTALPPEVTVSEKGAQEIARRTTRWNAESKEAGPLMQGALLRAPGLAVRLALVFHLISNARVDRKVPASISDSNIRRALDLMDKFFLPSAQLVAQDIKPSEEVAAARQLARHIVENGLTDFVNRSLRRTMKGPCADAKMMTAALRILCAANILHPYVRRPTGRGRSSNACFVNPDFLKNSDHYLAEIDRPL